MLISHIIVYAIVFHSFISPDIFVIYAIFFFSLCSRFSFSFSLFSLLIFVIFGLLDTSTFFSHYFSRRYHYCRRLIRFAFHDVWFFFFHYLATPLIATARVHFHWLILFSFSSLRRWFSFAFQAPSTAITLDFTPPQATLVSIIFRWLIFFRCFISALLPVIFSSCLRHWCQRLRCQLSPDIISSLFFFDVAAIIIFSHCCRQMPMMPLRDYSLYCISRRLSAAIFHTPSSSFIDYAILCLRSAFFSAIYYAALFSLPDFHLPAAIFLLVRLVFHVTMLFSFRCRYWFCRCSIHYSWY